MSDSFDPYYIWLGIPPKDQPPNHYRLLGLQDLEENTDVIDAAANRQTTYLHEMAAGPNRQESQQLLNEIAAARRCLLNPEKKQEYDEKLRADLAAATAASQPVVAPTAVPIAKAVVAPSVAPQIDTGESTVTEVPASNFSPQATPNEPASTDAGFPTFDTQPVSAAVPVVQTSSAGASTVSESAPKAAGKKPIPKQWILAGCSVLGVAIAAGVLSNGSEPEQNSKPQPTATRLTGSGSAETTSTESLPAGTPETRTASKEDTPRKKSKPSLFDQVSESDNIFNVPPKSGNKKKKKK